jgi:hypothetical protein
LNMGEESWRVIPIIKQLWKMCKNAVWEIQIWFQSQYLKVDCCWMWFILEHSFYSTSLSQQHRQPSTQLWVSKFCVYFF